MGEQVIYLDVFGQIESLIQQYMMNKPTHNYPQKLQVDPITKKYMEDECKRHVNMPGSVKLEQYRGIQIEVFQTELFYLNVV